MRRFYLVKSRMENYWHTHLLRYIIVCWPWLLSSTKTTTWRRYEPLQLLMDDFFIIALWDVVVHADTEYVAAAATMIAWIIWIIVVGVIVVMASIIHARLGLSLLLLPIPTPAICCFLIFVLALSSEKSWHETWLREDRYLVTHTIQYLEIRVSDSWTLIRLCLDLKSWWHNGDAS